MYVPRSFSAPDDAARALIRARPFATVVTVDGGAPFASHLPLVLVGEDRLVGHMARANPQWRHFGAGEVLAIFHGPHAYVSPTWYASAGQVPTWNYAVVHAYGAPAIVDGAAALAPLVEAFEAAWRPGDAELARLVPAIVGFELRVTRIEAKWKVGQNREPADRASAAARLRGAGGEDAAAIAQLMLDTLAGVP